MALFNYSCRELTLKIVYYGPGMSGKTTNLQHLHRSIQPEKRGKLLSLATENDRTLFFDFLPVNAGKVNDFDLRFQLYTVPGQVQYNATRRLVLKGSDAVVFVADSRQAMRPDNNGSFGNMFENLKANGLDASRMPIVLQFNKRDLGNIMPAGEMNADLNKNGYPVFLASAVNGHGVQETFRGVTELLLASLAHRQDLPGKTSRAVKTVPAAIVENAGTPGTGGEGQPEHPDGGLDSGLREIKTAIEDIRGAVSALASKLDALGRDLKDRPAQSGQSGPEDAFLSALRTEVSNLASVRAAFESERERYAQEEQKHEERPSAQTDELSSAAMRISLLEEAISLLKRLPVPKRKRCFLVRLFGRR